MSNNTKHSIKYIGNPTEFYVEHQARLDTIGGGAFHQPPEEFGVQVEERFGKAEIAQSIHVGSELVGFAVYNIIRGNLWRRNFVC